MNEPTHGDRSACIKCGGPIEYIQETGAAMPEVEVLNAWWAHADHPIDDHEAVPGGRRGKLEFHSETGTEGGYWAIQTDDSLHGTEELVDGKCPWTPGRCPVEAGDWHQHATYEGLLVLRNGDELFVFEEDGSTPKWKGAIELVQHPLFSEDAFGFWIHADQAGTNREEWAEMFFKELPATLVRTEAVE